MNAPLRIARAKQPVARRRAATAVEFAVVAPIILLMLLGAVEMTNLNFIRHAAAMAAHEGARGVIIVGGSQQLGRQRARDELALSGIAHGLSVSFDESSESVTATVRVPVASHSWGLGRFSRGATITQSCTLARQL